MSTVLQNKPNLTGTEHPIPALPPDLAEIANIWPRLPSHIRVGVVVMVKAAAEEHKD